MSRFRLKAPNSKLSENMVEKQCLDLLRLRQWFPVRIHTGTFKSADGKRWIKGADKGTPDYALIHARYPGFLLEVKRTGATPTPEQDRKHQELIIGFNLSIATVDSIEALVDWLTNYETQMRRLHAAQ